MISTTLGALANSELALKRLSEIRLPIKVSYQVGKLIRLVAAETPDFHKQREKLVRQYGSPHGDDIMVMPDQMAAFMVEMTALSEVPVTLDIAPLKLDSFGAIDISPADLIALSPLLSEDE